MKKLLIALGVILSTGALNAQSDFASVDLTVNLNPVASIELSGSAFLDINTIGQWQGIEYVESNHLFGTATVTGATNHIEVTTASFGNTQLDHGIAVVCNGQALSTYMVISNGYLPVGLQPGVNPIDIFFYSGYENLIGVPAGTYYNNYDLTVFSY